MTNLERVTKLAEECGALHNTSEVIYEVDLQDGSFVFNQKELLAFEQAVLAKRYESLQAKLAMLREIARDAEMWYSRDTMLGKELRMQAHNALNATQAEVDAFMAKKRAEWEKDVLEECYQMLCNTANTDWLRDRFQAMIKERGEV